MTSHYGFVHLSAGDLLRAEREDPSSEHANLIESYIRNGQLVPVEVSLGLLKKAMSLHPPSSIFLIDGFPRNFDNWMGWKDHMSTSASILSVLVYDCPVNVLERRILERGKTSGRSDDNLDSAKKRFCTFETQTLPVVKELAKYAPVVRLHGECELETVWKDTCVAVDDILAKEVKLASDNLSNVLGIEGEDPGDIIDEDIREEILRDRTEHSKHCGGAGGSSKGADIKIIGKVATITEKGGYVRVFERRKACWVLTFLAWGSQTGGEAKLS